MFKIEYIEIFYALILIPVFVLIFWYRRRKMRKTQAEFAKEESFRRLSLHSSKSAAIVKFSMLMLAYTFLIIAISNPQIGSKMKNQKRQGVDLMIALDVSNSMMASDIKPNRLGRSKRAIFKLIDQLEDDRIGIVVFAGKAYTQLPLTNDFSAAKMFLQNVDPGIIGSQGTAIGDAIETSLFSFDKNEKKNKAIIVITDGENHEDDAVEQAEKAKEEGVKVHCIGMGTSTGAPIPDKRGNFKKDQNGITVISKMDAAMLTKIASAGDGVYVQSNNSNVGLKKIFNSIKKMEKEEYEAKSYSEYESRYMYFLLASLFFLILELFIFERKSKWRERISLFD